MYTPFLRGRKFDLEALEDLSFKAKNYSNGKVIPIIEPIDFKPDYLKSYFTLVKRQIPFILVYNPLAVDILPDTVEHNLINGTLDGYEGYYLAFLISQQTTLTNVQNFVDRFSERKISFIHYSLSGVHDSITAYLNTLQSVNHHIFLSSALNRRYIDSVNSPGAKKISIIDSFNKQPTNAEYANNTLEYFSNLHNTFQASGFDGFGDFSIMGEKFDDGGGRARAVVIHWPFIDSSSGSMYIKHFVSDNVTGTEDIAGKFDEAYRKLATFRNEDAAHLDTLGNYFISQYGDKGRAPQLGAIKKFSIMHHIELTRSLFD